MRGRLFHLWCVQGDGATLSEFVGRERAHARQLRYQRRQRDALQRLMSDITPYGAYNLYAAQAATPLQARAARGLFGGGLFG